jgi:uncharacterized protein
MDKNMNEETQIIVRYRLQRATETLTEAKFVLSGGYAANAANRLYYASFYAVTALLASEQLVSKSHKGASILLHQNFVKQGRISIEHGKLYGQLFRLRQESDYEDLFDIELADAQGYVLAVEQFIAEISLLLAPYLETF